MPSLRSGSLRVCGNPESFFELFVTLNKYLFAWSWWRLIQVWTTDFSLCSLQMMSRQVLHSYLLFSQMQYSCDSSLHITTKFNGLASNIRYESYIIEWHHPFCGLTAQARTYGEAFWSAMSVYKILSWGGQAAWELGFLQSTLKFDFSNGYNGTNWTWNTQVSSNRTSHVVSSCKLLKLTPKIQCISMSVTN